MRPPRRRPSASTTISSPTARLALHQHRVARPHERRDHRAACGRVRASADREAGAAPPRRLGERRVAAPDRHEHVDAARRDRFADARRARHR